METSDSVWIEDDVPASLPSLNEFPRLSILHLMAWMAATAVAFLPYQLQRDSFTQSNAAANQLMQSVVMSIVMVGYGVKSGVYLFVTAAVVYWKRRGIAASLQPGHWLALVGALSWMLSMATWILIALAPDALPRAFMWMSMPRLGLALILLVWFLRLALKSNESAAWRWMYVVVAAAPLAELLVPVLTAWFVSPTSATSHIAAVMLTQGLFIAIGAALLAAAMLGDWLRNSPRHWSHWIVGAAVLVGNVVQIAYYVWYWLNLPI